MADDDKTKDDAATPAVVDGADPGSLPAVPDDDLDFIGDEELQMPRLAIDKNIGHYKLVVGGEAEGDYESFKIILLAVRVGRVYFDPKGKDPMPWCRSSDGIMGSGDPGGSCADCVHALWTEDNEGEKVKPPCAKTYDFIGIDESELPLFFTVKRTGMKPARALFTRLKREKKPLYAFLFEMTTEHQKRDAWEWYTPVFNRDKEMELPPEDLAKLAVLKARYEPLLTRYVVTQHEVEVGEGGDDDEDDFV